jgi:hypothetical protein
MQIECEVCGNAYDRGFELVLDEQVHTFDCFECAIHRLAPRCAHCGCSVIGHGSEIGGDVYCCAHCARMAGARAIPDRA